MSSIVFVAALLFGGLIIGALAAVLPGNRNGYPTSRQLTHARRAVLFGVFSSLFIGLVLVRSRTPAGLTGSLIAAALYVAVMNRRGSRSSGSMSASWLAAGNSGDCGGDSGGGAADGGGGGC